VRGGERRSLSIPSRIPEYYSDKLAHLGQELREPAARKALEINIAMRYIEEHFTGS
jgi:hypothetical protein